MDHHDAHHDGHHHSHYGHHDGHHHGHHDGHHPHVHHDYATANKDYFNETAQRYDDIPGAIEMAHRLAVAMRNEYPFTEDATTVMDYACGTGLISRELAPHTKSIVGVDVSQAMVDQYNTRVQNQGILPEEMKAVCVELKGEDGELDGAKFDVIVCGSSYHHFTSIDNVTRILSLFLKPGGCLLVGDLLKTDTSHEVFPDRVQHVVVHRGGFEESEMRKAFEGAGLESFSFKPTISAKHHDRPITCFLAKGIKPGVS